MAAAAKGLSKYIEFMKIILTLTALLCLCNISYAQHLIQIDDGSGNSLLLAPPAGMAGSLQARAAAQVKIIPLWQRRLPIESNLGKTVR